VEAGKTKANTQVCPYRSWDTLNSRLKNSHLPYGQTHVSALFHHTQDIIVISRKQVKPGQTHRSAPTEAGIF